jgi:propionyl-CoA synthetase
LRKIVNGEAWTCPPTIDDPAIPEAIEAAIRHDSAQVA